MKNSPKSSLYDLNEVAKRVRKVLGTKTLGKVEGILVEKTSANDTLMLSPTAALDPVFIVSYINDMGDNITIPIEASSLHISVRQGPYQKFPSEEPVTIPAYMD